VTRLFRLSTLLLLAGLVFSGPLRSEDRIDCFEACDTKMEACLDKCPTDKDGNPVEDCRNACALDSFHPCLDHCPHPRTGMSPAQKRKMDALAEKQKQEQGK
jgi:hypothetical protein